MIQQLKKSHTNYLNDENGFKGLERALGAEEIICKFQDLLKISDETSQTYQAMESKYNSMVLNKQKRSPPKLI